MIYLTCILIGVILIQFATIYLLYSITCDYDQLFYELNCRQVGLYEQLFDMRNELKSISEKVDKDAII
jgi:hypothetical protein